MNPQASNLRPRNCCAHCDHFKGQPLDIETALPGLSSLSSAYAAVRSNDGLCAVHGRYLAASSSCPSYEPARAPPPRTH